jgi:hypothetical protein
VETQGRAQTDAFRPCLYWNINKQILINMALVELLSEHAGLTEAQLLTKMQEIDLRDGQQDGKASNLVSAACEQCGKTYSKKHNHCLYCGHSNGAARVF